MLTNTPTTSRLVFLFVVLPYLLSAQQLIEGNVIDAQSKEPLSFAYVKLKDIAIGTVTDTDGQFQLNIPNQYKEYYSLRRSSCNP